MDADSAIRDYVQPQIVTVGDLHDIDLLYIITARGKCNLSAPTRKNWNTPIGLPGSFIFSMFFIISQKQF